MRLLVDSDAFCKLGIVDLLADAAALLGADLNECGRLPALVHMLRKGRLRHYGDEESRSLVPLAARMPAIAGEWMEGSEEWQDRLVGVPDIDPGEVILFSVAAARALPVLTGDMRALRALSGVDAFPERLAGRIVVLEAVLLGLCRQGGTARLRARVEPLRHHDSVVRACFSSSDAEAGLRSYFEDRRRTLQPLVLWDPGTANGP